MSEVVIISYVDPKNIRGLQTVALNYAKLIKKIGFDVSIFSKGESIDTVYVDGIQVNTYKYKNKMGIFKEFKSCRKAWKIHYSNRKISVVNGHDYMGYIFIQSLLNKSVKKIFTVHDPLLYHQRMLGKIPMNGKNIKYYICKYIEKRVEKISDITYVISKYTNERMVVRKDINSVDRKLVYDWIDMNKYTIPTKEKSKIKNELGFKGNPNIIFTLRGLEKRMGLDKLIEGFDLFNKTDKNSILLIGGRGPEEKNLKLLKNTLNNNNIIFLGYVEDEMVVKYYQAADVFIMPSIDGEGFGLPLLEAMACGTAVLGSNKCAIPEILSGKRELLIKNVDKYGIKEALIEFYKNKSSYYSEDFRQYVLDNFSEEKIKLQFENDFNG